MIFNKLFSSKPDDFKSDLYNEKTFFKQFLKDLDCCKNEVIIESPYITTGRMEKIYPIFKRILDRRTKVLIITRDPIDLDAEIRGIATNEVMHMADMGINVKLLRGKHHRKLAIIDRKILWEGSLNILSYNNSLEIMRRIESMTLSTQMLNFLNVSKFI